MPSHPKILKQRVVAKSRLFCVEELHLEFSNGITTQYERLVGSTHGAVLVVPIQDDDTFLLIREYAAGTGRYELGLPKGRVEPNEDALDAANREIKEEIGFGAQRLTQLNSVTLAPGYFNHTTHVILAQDLYPERLPGDEPEPIEVIPWSFSDLPNLLNQEDFTEARSIAALYMAMSHLKD